MCIVSFATTPWTNPGPTYIPVVTPAVQETYDWTPDTWSQFKEIIERLKDLDTKLGLKDCEDEEKGAWMKRVEERLKKLEVGVSKSG